MKTLATTISMVVLLLILFPGSSSFGEAPIYAQNTDPEIKSTQNPTIVAGEKTIFTSCPALLELPVMFGRSAPCTATYKIGSK